MECEVYGKIFKDAQISENTITYKDLTVDFNALFQNEIYNSYITERCTSQVLEGRNVCHFLVDVIGQQFIALCKDGLANFLEETTKCKVSGWVCQGSQAECLITDTPLALSQSSISSPFENLEKAEVRSVAGFDDKVGPILSDKLNNGAECLCVSFAFEIIPSIGTSKLLPVVNFIMFRSDNLYITKYITDVASLKDRLINNVASTDLTANLIGFYLCGNFQSSATINLQKHCIKPQLTLAQNLQRVLSFPAVNDIYSKTLFHKILKKQKGEEEEYDPALINTLKSDLQSLALDNVKLLKENEELHRTMDNNAIDMNNLMNSKNILGEEVREKLANEQDIYNKLTEMAVDKVKLKDVSESKRYELMNKVFELENELLEAQIVGEEWKGRFEGLRGEKESVEQLKNDLQSEYISLKSSYREMMTKQTSLERRSEQLSLEVINLHLQLDAGVHQEPLNTAKPLPQITSKSSLSNINSTDYTAELAVLRLSTEAQQASTKAEHIKLVQQILTLTQANSQLKRRVSLEESSQHNKKELIERTLHLQHANDVFNKKLETVQTQCYTLTQKNEELSQEVEESNVQLTALTMTKSQLQGENTALRLKQRNAVEEYRIRLECYIKDTAQFLTQPDRKLQLQAHVNKLLQEYKASFEQREASLQCEMSEAKAELHDTLHKYHTLNARDKEFSGLRVVQKELERLREENKLHKSKVTRGDLLGADKVEAMLKTLQTKYEGKIQHLQHKVTSAEGQLARLMSHIQDR